MLSNPATLTLNCFGFEVGSRMMTAGLQLLAGFAFAPPFR
jgi:hypothetical protein